MLNIELQTTHGLIIVRPISENDVQAFRDLRLAALRNHPNAFGSDYEENLTFPPSYWSDRVQANINNDQGVIMVAQSGDQLIGMTGCQRERGTKVHHNAYIWGVYVDAQWRGARILHQLMLGCERWGVALGVRIFTLGVSATNTSAIQAYVRAGYQVYGVSPDTIYFDGRYHDELLMFKRFATQESAISLQSLS